MSETGSGNNQSQGRRRLRERKQRKHYLEEWATGDDDSDGIRGFSVAEKLESYKFAQVNMVKEMKGEDLTLSYIQSNGFNIPLLFRDKAGLGIRVPSPEFSVYDVRLCVGSSRMLEVMDVNTQKNIQMTMKEWQHYYDKPEKDRLLNVISLEFSHTKMDSFVQAPEIVRQIDWVDTTWPKALKDQQSDDYMGYMMYPKVQKYCLMSVKNCYTDFHIDFGGTSVWYHILKGSKVFWLIPPTEKNLQLYEKWVLSGKQSDIFFGDTVEKCCRVYLTAGNTFFIPTGWIHAVYTPTDSLVFGGNFLHSFGIVKQLKTAAVEDATKVPQKFRYPFFTEMLWYVLARYVNKLLGKSHLEGDEAVDQAVVESRPHINLTHYELFGLKEIVMYLYDLPPNKKNVPEMLKDPVELIKDVRTLVERHCKDKPELANTNIPVIPPQEGMHPEWKVYNRQELKDQLRKEIAAYMMELNRQANQENQQQNTTETKVEIKTENNTETSTISNSVPNGVQLTPQPEEINFATPNVARPRVIKKAPPAGESITPGGSGSDSKNNGQPRRRRTRCKVCEACKTADCGECAFCLDMIKFGGTGRAKQTCMRRQCLSPMLPVTSQCIYCHLDGWWQTPITPQSKSNTNIDGPSSLMECTICYEIAHPRCAQPEGDSEVKGNINPELRNSWECPTCCKTGKNTDYKPRHFRGRQKSPDNRRHEVYTESETTDNASTINSTVKTEPNDGTIKNEVEYGESSNSNSTFAPPVKRRKSDQQNNGTGVIVNWSGNTPCLNNPENGEISESSTHSSLSGFPRKKNSVRSQLAQQILNSSTRTFKKPSYVVRPAPLTNQQLYPQTPNANIAYDPTALKAIFRYLPPESLVTCSAVCKIWSNVSVDPDLWKVMNCAEHKLSASLLTAIVRRQPEQLILDWTQIAKRQLSWLIQRLPAMKHLSLQNCPIQAVPALHTCNCPTLQVLDLSFVRGLNDGAIREILSPPKDSRPGLTDSKSRLRGLKRLNIAGTDISDVALRYITQSLQQLVHLDLSSCQRVTDAGIAQIGTCQNAINTLVELNLSGCRLVTEAALDYLSKCEKLIWLDLRHVPNVSTQSVIKFAAKSKHDLCVKDIKLVERRNLNKK